MNMEDYLIIHLKTEIKEKDQDFYCCFTCVFINQ